MNLSPSRRRIVALLAAALVVFGGLAAVVLSRTASGGGRTPSASPPAPGASEEPTLAVDVEKPRYLVAERMVEVIVRNEGTTPVEVAQIQLFGSLFDARPPIPKDTLLQPGERKDLKVAYGPVRCGVRAPPSPRPFVRLRVRASDGSETRARLALPSPSPTLQRLQNTECGLLALREAVRVAYAGGWSRTGAEAGGARGTLVLARRGSQERIVLTGVGGNVIFTVTVESENSPRPAGRPLATLRPDDDRLALPVTVEATRCDAHAVADSKKTFLLPLWLRLDAAEEQYLEVEVSGRGRRVLTDLIGECVAAEHG
ncbi:MAG: hypothetical protein M3415_07505 [Actinomycetota bacterium]|nr:hypothetical protein [Actinomycetota bacterium]